MSNFTTTVCDTCDKPFEHIISPTRTLTTCSGCIRRKMGIREYKKNNDAVPIPEMAPEIKIEIKKTTESIYPQTTVSIPPKVGKGLGSLAKRYGDIKKLTSLLNHRVEGR